MRRFWGQYNLSIVLIALMLLCYAAQAIVGWSTFTANELTHGKAPHLFGSGGYVWVWLETTLANAARSFFQLYIGVLLFKHFIHAGSPEGRERNERDEQTRRTLADIQGELKTLAMRQYELAAGADIRSQNIEQILERMGERKATP